MGLFDSAISNLSRMAINESAVELPRTAPAALVDEFKAMLDMMPMLEESEMVFPVDAVPVRECKRLGKYLIEMEDISRYTMTNGITNLLEAISNIGKANGIRLDESNTALVIDEYSILEEMADLGFDIGGGNSNDGNIGTVGLLGRHDDIDKFRRFANSREFVDLVANKYGLPIVKKKYSIGLKKADEGSVVHKGNIQESADEDMIDKAEDKNQKPINEKESEKVSVEESYDPLQMMRDIASGKYDQEIMAESYGLKKTRLREGFDSSGNLTGANVADYNKVDSANDSLSVIRAKQLAQLKNKGASSGTASTPAASKPSPSPVAPSKPNTLATPAPRASSNSPAVSRPSPSPVAPSKPNTLATPAAGLGKGKCCK